MSFTYNVEYDLSSNKYYLVRYNNKELLRSKKCYKLCKEQVEELKQLHENDINKYIQRCQKIIRER